MSVPYSPTTFAFPAINPTFGGILGDLVPYLSPTGYRFIPTSMSTQDLIPNTSTAPSNAAAQEQAFYDVLHRASEWVDRICFGAVASSKRTGLRASINVEAAEVPVVKGWLKLTCDVKPIIEVRGVDAGLLMGSLTSVGQTLANAIRIGRRTIYVPYAVPYFTSSFRNYADVVMPSKLSVVWAYVAGFPHTQLQSSIAVNDATCTLVPTDGANGLLGVYPGTVMELVDGVQTEHFVVQSVVNNVITPTAPFANAHSVPQAPDFLAVTAVPPGVRLACSYLVTALLKTRGDSSIALEEITEPRQIQDAAGGVWSDIKLAKDMLTPYKVRVKVAR